MGLSVMFKKTLWRERGSKVWSFFCPYCKAERRVPFDPRPGRLMHYVQVGLTSALFTCAFWPVFQWKGGVSFLPFWAIFEILYRGRVRARLSCPSCGFDPYLYLTDMRRARQEIENSWRRKFVEKGIPFPEKEGGRADARKDGTSAKNASLTETRPGR